ncbi:MAG: dTMP kinase [Candidatus Cloacimonetes bacterium]|nr:dTMP kinase [Candidatus Cloacimonadota bacterium]MBS3768144.1 dTMP kinase [Candidatus Cloacimonadota bacterium]
MKGKFITFEGVEGCGKSTQAQLLVNFFKYKGFDVLFTREPGGPPISEEIRKILLNKKNKEMHKLTEVFLYMASRAQHTTEWIIPALEQGKIVICDRYYDSTYAYQGNARKISKEVIDYLNHVATAGLEPDLTFILDLPVEIGLKRIKKLPENEDGIDRLEGESQKFHQDVRSSYIELAKKEPNRVILLDGLKKIKEIHKKIIANIKNKISILNTEVK